MNNIENFPSRVPPTEKKTPPSVPSRKERPKLPKADKVSQTPSSLISSPSRTPSRRSLTTEKRPLPSLPSKKQQLKDDATKMLKENGNSGEIIEGYFVGTHKGVNYSYENDEYISEEAKGENQIVTIYKKNDVEKIVTNINTQSAIKYINGKKTASWTKEDKTATDLFNKRYPNGTKKTVVKVGDHYVQVNGRAPGIHKAISKEEYKLSQKADEMLKTTKDERAFIKNGYFIGEHKGTIYGFDFLGRYSATTTKKVETNLNKNKSIIYDGLHISKRKAIVSNNFVQFSQTKDAKGNVTSEIHLTGKSLSVKSFNNGIPSEERHYDTSGLQDLSENNLEAFARNNDPIATERFRKDRYGNIEAKTYDSNNKMIGRKFLNEKNSETERQLVKTLGKNPDFSISWGHAKSTFTKNNNTLEKKISIGIQDEKGITPKTTETHTYSDHTVKITKENQETTTFTKSGKPAIATKGSNGTDLRTHQQHISINDDKTIFRDNTSKIQEITLRFENQEIQTHGSFIIKKTFDENGRLSKTEYFDKGNFKPDLKTTFSSLDTILTKPIAEETFSYEEGTVTVKTSYKIGKKTFQVETTFNEGDEEFQAYMSQEVDRFEFKLTENNLLQKILHHANGATTTTLFTGDSFVDSSTTDPEGNVSAISMRDIKSGKQQRYQQRPKESFYRGSSFMYGYAEEHWQKKESLPSLENLQLERLGENVTDHGINENGNLCYSQSDPEREVEEMQLDNDGYVNIKTTQGNSVYIEPGNPNDDAKETISKESSKTVAIFQATSSLEYPGALKEVEIFSKDGTLIAKESIVFHKEGVKVTVTSTKGEVLATINYRPESEEYDAYLNGDTKAMDYSVSSEGNLISTFTYSNGEKKEILFTSNGRSVKHYDSDGTLLRVRVKNAKGVETSTFDRTGKKSYKRTMNGKTKTVNNNLDTDFQKYTEEGHTTFKRDKKSQTSSLIHSDSFGNTRQLISSDKKNNQTTIQLYDDQLRSQGFAVISTAIDITSKTTLEGLSEETAPLRTTTNNEGIQLSYENDLITLKYEKVDLANEKVISLENLSLDPNTEIATEREIAKALQEGSSVPIEYDSATGTLSLGTLPNQIRFTGTPPEKIICQPGEDGHYFIKKGTVTDAYEISTGRKTLSQGVDPNLGEFRIEFDYKSSPEPPLIFTTVRSGTTTTYSLRELNNSDSASLKELLSEENNPPLHTEKHIKSSKSLKVEVIVNGKVVEETLPHGTVSFGRNKKGNLIRTLSVKGQTERTTLYRKDRSETFVYNKQGTIQEVVIKTLDTPPKTLRESIFVSERGVTITPQVGDGEQLSPITYAKGSLEFKAYTNGDLSALTINIENEKVTKSFKSSKGEKTSEITANGSISNINGERIEVKNRQGETTRLLSKTKNGHKDISFSRGAIVKEETSNDPLPADTSATLKSAAKSILLSDPKWDTLQKLQLRDSHGNITHEIAADHHTNTSTLTELDLQGRVKTSKTIESPIELTTRSSQEKLEGQFSQPVTEFSFKYNENKISITPETPKLPTLMFDYSSGDKAKQSLAKELMDGKVNISYKESSDYQQVFAFGKPPNQLIATYENNELFDTSTNYRVSEKINSDGNIEKITQFGDKTRVEIIDPKTKEHKELFIQNKSGEVERKIEFNYGEQPQASISKYENNQLVAKEVRLLPTGKHQEISANKLEQETTLLVKDQYEYSEEGTTITSSFSGGSAKMTTKHKPEDLDIKYTKNKKGEVSRTITVKKTGETQQATLNPAGTFTSIKTPDGKESKLVVRNAKGEVTRTFNLEKKTAFESIYNSPNPNPTTNHYLKGVSGLKSLTQKSFPNETTKTGFRERDGYGNIVSEVTIEEKKITVEKFSTDGRQTEILHYQKDSKTSKPSAVKEIQKNNKFKEDLSMKIAYAPGAITYHMHDHTNKKRYKDNNQAQTTGLSLDKIERRKTLFQALEKGENVKLIRKEDKTITFDAKTTPKEKSAEPSKKRKQTAAEKEALKKLETIKESEQESLADQIATQRLITPGGFAGTPKTVKEEVLPQTRKGEAISFPNDDKIDSSPEETPSNQMRDSDESSSRDGEKS